MAVHVFWDNSNIWISLQNLCRERENVPTAALRVNLKALEDFVVRDRKTGMKAIAGSYPPECEDLISYAKSMGYDTTFMHRVDDGTRIREQGVDMSLHYRMLETIVDSDKPEVMALLTGDSGIDPESNTGFIKLVERALKKGWTVEVYAVKESLSQRNYQPLIDKFGDNLQIEFLDDVYEQITFLVEGDFFFHETPEKIVHVAERRSLPKSWR